ncbi:MAG: lamin tail domain-containing protein, partial [Candidatus Halalkalibacterium sp. M3_1C_030]
MFELLFKLPCRLSADEVSIIIRFAFSILLFQIAPSLGLAQNINFQDGFSDGDFSQNSTWSGDTASFTITDIQGNYQLRLQGDNLNGGVSYLSAASVNTVGSWEFYLNLDGFSPSDGNRAEIILMSDIPDLKGAFNGYALQAGENGSSDVFRLVRYNNGFVSFIVLSGTTDISSGGDYKIKVTREDDGTWNLYVADTYGGLALLETESRVDNTFTTSSYFGLLVTYTSTRYNRFFFDFKIDLPPFSVKNVSGSEHWVEATFNRSYDPASVQIDDFLINKEVGRPVSLNFVSPHTIRLEYNATINSERYTLSLNNITDVHGESIPDNTDFEFVIFGIPGLRDVVINEFMYDPPIGLPEYVELKNRSGNYLNVMGWQIGDQSGMGNISIDTLVFEPEELLVVSPDTAALINIFGPGNYLNISSGNFPSLNNSGDAIRILNNNGVLLDSLFYNPDWGGEDIALERRSDSAASDKKANWGDSPHRIGTPGLPNLIAKDLEPPVFKNLQILNPKTLLLIFDEELSPTSATQASNYSISPGVDIRLISAVDDTVYLALTEDLRSLQTYRITVTGLQDIFGNITTAQSKELKYIKFGKVKPGDIVINEILFDEVENGSPEFIELINTTDNNFDLTGWLLGDASDSATLPSDTDLLAGGYLILTGHSGFAGAFTNAQYISRFPSLNNSGDIVYLRDSDNTTVDSLSYTSKWVNRQPGLSIERKDPSAASNDPSNWAISKDEQGHTASIINSIYNPDRLPPKMIFARRHSTNLVNVQFSEFIILNTDLVFTSNNAALSIEHFDASNGGTIILRASSSNLKSVYETLQVRNLTDIRGNLLD